MEKLTDLEAGQASSSAEPATSNAPEVVPVPRPDPEGSDSSSDWDTSSSEISDDLGSERAFDWDDGPNTATDNPPTVRYCPYFPEGETAEQCKARIVRIVDMQKKCHGKSKTRGSN
jgi:hypothetical protein